MSRITEFSPEKLAGPTNAFFAVGDHQNLRNETANVPMNIDDIRNELHFYLLFCNRLTLVAEDLLLNEHLTSLLLAPDYRELLETGVFVPLLRSHYDTFADVIHYLKKPDLYNPVPSEVYSPLLAQLKGLKLFIGRFDEDLAYENFTTIARHYFLSPLIMRRLRLEKISNSVSQRMDALCVQAKRTQWRRSLLFYYAQELDGIGMSHQARAVRHIASVLYSAQYSGYFNQLPAFPDWYGQYLGPLTGILPRLTNQPERLCHLKSISLEYLSPHIKPQAGRVSLRDILEIRQSSQFKSYISELEKSNAAFETNQVSEHTFLAALESYIRFIDRRFGEIFSRKRTAKRRKERFLSITRYTTPVGIIVSLIGTAAAIATDYPITKISGPLWSTISLSFFLYRMKLERDVAQIDIETAKFWSAWCTPKGTFAATLARSQQAIIHRLSSENNRSLP